MMTRTLSVLGSTGSIGTQTLEVAASCGHRVAALTAYHNIDLLEQQARAFHPILAAAADPTAAAALASRLSDTDIQVLGGEEGVLAAAALPQADTVVTAVVGIAGLAPTLAAIDGGKRIALANKETMVCAGPLVTARATEKGAEIVPVDSEHSAIFQCLQGSRSHGEIKRVILTASGGPFFGKSREELKYVTRADALKHPNWSMGAKITIDSATLMNKGLEFIEAMRLYRLTPDQVSIAVHPQSIIHSLVEYRDNAVLAQLGVADMRLPIQYALTYPDRTEAVAATLDLFSCPPLTFAKPDLDTFQCLKLALEAARKSGTPCAVLNGANEAAVGLFLQDKIGFLDIADLVQYALETVPEGSADTLEQILTADHAAREAVTSAWSRM